MVLIAARAGLVAGDEGVQHPHPEVEALQDEEARPQGSGDDEPERGERHIGRPQ
ncbi:hypothetical protein ACFQ1I_02415 [Kitasatospora arboriphila]